MIDLGNLSSELLSACSTEPLIFVDLDPSDPDTTTMVNLSLKLNLSGVNGFSKSLVLTTENYLHVLSLFDSILTTKKKPLVGYNFKNLFSFYRRLSKKNLSVSNFLDLYWYESYCGLESSQGNLKKALHSVKTFTSNKEVFSLYKNIYSDIISKVIPGIESFCLINDDTGKAVYSNYHIEGQENGRLSCSCDKRNVFNPHSLGDEKKHLIFYDISYKYFLQFDYKNMEVSVLAKLSDDKELNSILSDNKNDVYSQIFYRITNLKHHDDSKNFGKKMFLPLIYGQTPNGLAKNLDISLDQAEIYYNSAKKIFKQAFDYVEQAQAYAHEHGYAVDIFGRKRFFDSGEHYKARNFIVQSPSALICLEALLKLYRNTNDLFSLAFHVHDGYFLAIKKDKIQDAFFAAKKILESPTDLMPGLELRVSAKAGSNLEKMFEIDNRK